MGIDYCLVFDNEEASHAFEVFKFFPLVIQELDEIAEANEIDSLGEYLHHDPESDPTELRPGNNGLKVVVDLIDGVMSSGKKKFGSFAKSEILEELDQLREALEENKDIDTNFSIALVY